MSIDTGNDRFSTGGTREYTTKVYYLELVSRAQINPMINEDDSVKVHQVYSPSPGFARSLYLDVGKGWYWLDRYSWSLDQWRDRFSDPFVSLWIMRSSHETLGYYELESQKDGDMEICYLGLRANAIGVGLGGYMLTHALGCAFDLGASRPWLHTCCLDHPNALTNYRARGMKVYKICQEIQFIPKKWPDPNCLCNI
jgi:GNAT superfamily N-acetyltransferase